MARTKILVPLDGSEKSMHSLKWIKKFKSPEEVEITLFHVVEAVPAKETFSIEDARNIGLKSQEVLDKAAKEMEGYVVEKSCANYEVDKLITWGHTADLILSKAKEGNYDLIVMTKSSEKGFTRIIGSVTHKVIRDSETIVVVIPD